MNPRQYGRLLAQSAPPLTETQVEAAARLYAGMGTEGVAA